MYNVGDLIIYGGEGVCRVEQISGAPTSAPSDRLYYQLRPLYCSGTIYAPTDVSVRMRPVLTRDEALSLIRGVPDMNDEVDLPADIKQAAETYRTYLQTYDCKNLLQLIRLIYVKREEAAQLGKNFSQTDDRFFKRAKELLYGELAVSLGIPVDDVEPTITKLIDAEA